MKTRYIFIAALFLTVMATANTKHADRLFNKWDYCKAAKLYEKKAQKHPSQDVYYKLGQCYQKMHRYKDALVAYDDVNALGAYNDESFYLNYGLVLKANERYNDAETAFTTYSNMASSDPRGQFYKNSCDTILKDMPYNLPITIDNVSSLNSNVSDFCPALYKDGVVFISSRKAEGHGAKVYGWDGEYYLDIFYAKKGTSDTNFPSLAPMQGDVVNGKFHNGPVAFSKNFDTVYFNRVSKELKGQEKRTLQIERNKIYCSVYKDGKWGKLQPFQYNNDTFSVATPCLANNGSRIYFSSDMPGGYGGDDIYYCDRTSDGWSKPVNAGPAINTFGDEKFPAIDSAGDLYFSSNGYMGYGGMDICISKNENGAFTKARVMKEPFNSPGDDYGVTFIKNGRVGYFSSNRNGGKGDEDIYYFNLDKDNLPCPVVLTDYVIGYRCMPKPLAMDTARLDTAFHFATVPGLKYNINLENQMARVHFNFNKYNVRRDAAKILDSVALFMIKYPDIQIQINGYCDSRGSYAYNMTLSEHRANAAINYLASKGVNRNRMMAKGCGKTHFLNRCIDGVLCADFEHQENRRVEIVPSTGQTTLTSK